MWLKIFALAMGLLLWFHVATDKVYNHQLNLPISEIAVGDDLSLIGGKPDSMMVVVSATGKQLLRTKWQARGLRINAGQFHAGRHNMTLTTANTFLVDAGNQVTLEEIVFPTSLLLNIDFRLERSLPVVPDIIATPDDGYAVKIISEPTPNEVTVIGPRTVVQGLSRVNTERKELTGLRNDIDLTLPIVIPPGQDISIEPDSVRISLEIVPVKTRVFDGIPVVVYNSPPGREVLINPATIRVELTGPPAEIDLLNRNALIASVDYRQLDSNFTAAIKIDCPSHFRVKETSADSATLTVR